MYKIMIIDDDPAIRTNMELILKMEGFTVNSAGDGKAGIAKIREKRPDLILCDIMMPKMDGRSLLELLKEDSDCSRIPFVFVTALTGRTDVRSGMTAGADDYLTKPFSAEELVATVTGRLHRLAALRHSSLNNFRDEQVVLRKLSARERQVLLLVGNGATSRNIGERLGITLRTVEVHRSNLMKKLNVANAASLARWSVIAEQM